MIDFNNSILFFFRLYFILTKKIETEEEAFNYDLDV